MDYYNSKARLARIVPQMTIFELIDLDPALLSIFERLDIKLPFGDISLAQMAEREHFSVDLFVELCRMHIDEEYTPSREALTREMIPQLLLYLRASHAYYINCMLPHTSEHLDAILEGCDTLSRDMFKRFYDDYVRYVEAHLDEEERLIFSVIETSQTPNRDLQMLEVPHSDIDDRTHDIASLIVKYLPEQASTVLRCAMLADIYSLRDDLRRHGNVEMLMLKPLVEKFL